MASTVECVARWHYRPAINDGQLADAPMTVKVDWNLGDDDADKSATADKRDTTAGGEK